MNVKNEKLTYYNSFEFIRLVTVSLNVAKLVTQVIAFCYRFQCLAAATKKHKNTNIHIHTILYTVHAHTYVLYSCIHLHNTNAYTHRSNIIFIIIIL